MKYDIYFHNDFDGRASAAVMLAFLRSRGDDIERYIAMSYGEEKEWYKENFFRGGNPAIVVDFTYHPKAAWWFDHHSTTFKKPEWKKYFKPDSRHHLDASYRSCCRLVYDVLRREFGWKPPRHFAELVKWLDILDGAKYASARQTIEMKEPAIQLNSFLEALSHTAKEDKRIIDLLATLPLEKVMKDRLIAKAYISLRSKVEKSVAYFKKNTRQFKKTTFIDLTKDPLKGLLRYAPFYFWPKSEFGIRMKSKGKLWYLGVGANPWRKLPAGIDLGEMMRKYHGGGHKGVGATEFKTKKEALKAFEEINATLNG